MRPVYFPLDIEWLVEAVVLHDETLDPLGYEVSKLLRIPVIWKSSLIKLSGRVLLEMLENNVHLFPLRIDAQSFFNFLSRRVKI